MSVVKRLWLDGRVVAAVAACGVALQFVWMNVAKVRGVEHEGLVVDAAWAAGMAAVLGWALASARRGPVGGRKAAGYALAVCLICVAGVAIELAAKILHPSRS